MAIEIRETIVTPDGEGSAVQITISDARLEDEDASLRLVLFAKLPAYEPPLLAQLQREVMRKAQTVLSDILQATAREVQEAGHPQNPNLRR